MQSMTDFLEKKPPAKTTQSTEKKSMTDLLDTSASSKSMTDFLNIQTVNPQADYYAQNAARFRENIENPPPVKSAVVAPPSVAGDLPIEMRTTGPVSQVPLDIKPGPVMSEVKEFSEGVTDVATGLIKPTVGAIVGGAVGGVPGAIVGAGITSQMSDAYDAWKAGDLPKMADILTMGVVSNATQKLSSASQNLMNLRPTSAISDIAKAVPFFGPMTEMVEQQLREGKYARALGTGVGVAGSVVVPAAVHKAIVTRASSFVADEVGKIDAEAQAKVQEITSTPDSKMPPEVKQEQLKTVQDERNQKVTEAIKDAATKEITNEVAAVTEKKVKAAKVRTPEQIEADKARMAALRAKRGKGKAATTEQVGAAQPEAAPVITPQIPTPEPTTVEKPLIEGYVRSDVTGNRYKVEGGKVQQLINDQWKDVPTSDQLYGEIAKSLEANDRRFVQDKGPEVRTKIEQTPVEQPTLTPEEITRLDALNPEWFDLPNEEIYKLLGREPGKVTEPITDLDMQTGTAEPATLDTNNSPFRTDPEGTAGQRSMYARNKSVANNIDELLNQDPRRLVKDPSVTLWKLQNDVNRWLDGDESIDIAKTRDLMSDLVTHADQFSGFFDKPDFEGWKELASDAAKWARKADRIKIEQTGGFSLHSGIDPYEVGKQVKKWYSSLRRVAEEKLPNIASAEQIKNTLRKLVTNDEWKNSQLDDLLKPGTRVRKEEVLAQIDRNVPEFKDVVLGEQADTPELQNAHTRLAILNDRVARAGTNSALTNDEWIEVNYLQRLIENSNTGNTKFSSYVEPGGSNYKELFVTAPLDRNKYAEFEKQHPMPEYYSGKLYYDKLQGSWERDRTWQDGHADYSDIENPIVRLRFNDRYIDIPSDHPLRTQLNTVESKLKKVDSDISFYSIRALHEELSKEQKIRFDNVSSERFKLQDEADNIRSEISNQRQKVLFIEEMQPPNPENQAKMPPEFVKRWREIGMKRAIKYALDGGYDKVAWTTGEMQVKRYSLSKQIDRLDWNYDPRSGTYSIIGFKNGPGEVINESGMSPLRLSRLIGSDLADQIMAESKNTRSGIIEGENLDIGGAGIKKVYDLDLPNVAKKLGGKVEKVDLESVEGRNFYKTPEEIVDQYLTLEVGKSGKFTYVVNKLGEETFGWDEGEPIGREYNSEVSARNNAIDTIRRNPPKITSKTTMTVPSFSLSSFQRSWTPTLYSGLPLDRIAEEALNMARKFSKSVDFDRSMKDFKPGEFAKELRKDVARALLERSGTIRNELINQLGDKGYYIVQRMYLTRGASAKATNMLHQMRKEVNDGLSGSDQKILDKLVLATRMVDIGKYKEGKQFSFPTDKDPAKSAAYLNFFEQMEGLDPKKAEQLRQATKAYFEWMKKPLQDMLTEGLISQREYDRLITHNYRRIGTVDSPTTLADVLDKKYEVKLGNTKLTVHDSGIERLAKGKQTDIYEPSREIMALETFNRAYGRIFNNQANRSLLELARTEPDNPFVRVKIKKLPETRAELLRSIPALKKSLKLSSTEYNSILTDEIGKTSLTEMTTEELTKAYDVLGGTADTAQGKSGAKIPTGWTPTFVYEGGKRRTMFLSPDMAKEWITASKDITPRTAKILRYASFSPITRTFATGIEWSFALANIPRDVMQLWFAARTFEDGQWKGVYSAWAPKFGFELGHDLTNVFSDALLRKGRWNDYIDYGGGMDFLVHQARPFQRGLHLEGPVEKAYNFLGYFNETSEALTRLAITERVLRNKAAEQGISIDAARKNPKLMTEAVFAARDYMDFSQGGWFTKAVDQAIPYLNAGTVGMRGFLRVFKPGSGSATESMFKLSQFAAAITGIYLASQYMTPETHKALKGDINTQNNVIIPLGDSFGFEDEKGQMRYPYLKIPLDQNLRFFKKFVEACTDKWQGNEVDSAGTANALQQLSPVGLSSLPPTFSAGFGYYYNIDTWKNEAIWKKTDKPLNWPASKEEYIPGQTPQIAIDTGDVTKLSPERLRYVTRQLIANSMFGDLVGGAYEKAFGQLPKEKKEQHLAEVLAKVPGIRRFIGITNPYTQYGQVIDEALQNSMVKKFVETRGLDALVDSYLHGGKTTREEITDYIKSFKDAELAKRLTDDFVFSVKTKDLPDRTFLLRMKRMAPDARAEVYVREMSKASPAEQSRMNKELVTADILTSKDRRLDTGIFNNKFWEEVSKIRSSQKTQ